MVIRFLRFGRSALLCLALLSALLWATGRLAMAQSWNSVSEVISVTPMAGWRAEPGRHIAGLRFELQPGWKTYWRSAGSAGIAPRMTWGGSENVNIVAPSWPTPGLFRQAGALSIGYDSDFVLPLVVEIGEGHGRLRGRLDLGVCADICLPVQLEIVIDLPTGGDPDVDLFAALTDRPQLSDQRVLCSTRPSSDGLMLTGALDLPPLGGTEAVVFEVSDPALWVTDSVVGRDGDRITASAELVRAGGAPVTLKHNEVRITVIGAHGAVELAGCAE